MKSKSILILWVLLLIGLSQAAPLGTAFTYQGELKFQAAPANGPFDFQFQMFDVDVDGVAIGDPVLLEDVEVVDGVFTVELDFGLMPFSGDQLWLAIGVRDGASDDPHTDLVPRQKITAVPYALHAEFVAMNAVGSDEVDSNQVQLRVQGTCPSGQAVVGVNADGSVICTLFLAFPTRTTTVDDPANNVGLDTSIAIGADGLPVISYYDQTAGALKVAKCNDPACAGLNETITTVDDPANTVGLRTSIAIGANDLPVISYWDQTAGALKVAKCTDPACAGATITTVDDPANGVGFSSSIAIGANDLPVISYWDDAEGTLKFAKCNDPACAGATITTVDDPDNSVGSWTSIAIGANDLPVISYYDQTAGALKVAKCNDVACAGGDETITTVDDPANIVGQYTSIAIGANDLPVISYWDATASALKVAKCGDPDCSEITIPNTIFTVDDPANLVGRWTSIAIGIDDLPVISYHDETAFALKVAKCNDPVCSGATITTVDDPANFVGRHTSIAIGADGLPVISYTDLIAGALKVAKCGNLACQ